MAKDVDEIVVAPNGTVWVADTGTAAPVDEVTPPGVGWTDLGYTTEDAATMVVRKAQNQVKVWQLAAPARYVLTGLELAVRFALVQWSKDTIPLAWAGGAVSTPSPGHFRYDFPTALAPDDRAFMLDWEDGAKNYRLVVPKSQATGDVESALRKSDAAPLPIEMSAMGTDGVGLAYLLTNDPAFA